MTPAKTNAQRQAALKARRKAAGLVPVTVWVYKEHAELVRRYAKAVDCLGPPKVNADECDQLL